MKGISKMGNLKYKELLPHQKENILKMLEKVNMYLFEKGLIDSDEAHINVILDFDIETPDTITNNDDMEINVNGVIYAGDDTAKLLESLKLEFFKGNIMNLSMSGIERGYLWFKYNIKNKQFNEKYIEQIIIEIKDYSFRRYCALIEN